MIQEFYSSGKLMITGEYLVLNGSMSLAVPTKLGQTLRVSEMSGTGSIHWQAKDPSGDTWFETNFIYTDRKLNNNSDDHKVKVLKKILEEAIQLNLGFLSEKRSIEVITELEFPREWGLGSSSTLISNIANWARVDPLQLFQNSLSGSGYDVAVALEQKAILYSLRSGKPQWQVIPFDPEFKEDLIFVYLGNKQISSKEIERYRLLSKPQDKDIHRITEISEALLLTSRLDVFEGLLTEHEAIISKILGEPPIKQRLFPDYKGCLKSLGAWGGDFILASGKQSSAYFSSKGYKVIIPWKDMVK